MISNRLPAILVGLAVILFLVYSSVFVVNQREQAIVIRFGEIQDVKDQPGIYFKLPFAFMDADRVQYVENRSLRFDLDNIRVQVRGGAFYEVDAFVVYAITDPRRFRETVSGDRESAESRLSTRLDAALRRVYGLRNFSAALSDERVSMMQEVRADLNGAAESLGLSIRDVRIRRTDLTQEVSSQTFQRMRAERLAEAELIRARGNEAGQRRRAIADREVVEFVSEAQKDSEILRGQGDAERNRIFAEAFQRDPSFFEFYRSMRAYVSALGDNNTTMVLSPDSDFFKFFESPDGRSAPPAGAAASTPPAPAN
ncbi:protease modulator HflC [Aliirhizobium smilacinae]|uniref:Protein HflC n=1 Tax=Aliirhizobium smilacinae TaxID=1395944 RepID=A0A5C4XH59_9HYPH|nr:protease modulator HflC [Rhizobium smilacinae]TNM62221.1 protease modulator HflC [Rhizobium smilacinae]